MSFVALCINRNGRESAKDVFALAYQLVKQNTSGCIGLGGEINYL